VALRTGIVAFAVPQGFVAGLLRGTLVYGGMGRYGVEAGTMPAAGSEVE
jgi:hypothetical protein